MSSFDYELKDHLRRAGAPIVDYDLQPLSNAVDQLIASHRRYVRSVAAFCLAIGFLAGVSIPLIFGAA